MSAKPPLAPLALLVAQLSLAGCASVLAQVVPSHDQSLDVAAMPAGRYDLDPEHAALLFEVDHMGFAGYIGRMTRLEASLTLEPKTPANSRVTATVDMAGVDVNHPKLADSLRGAGYFDVGRFPQAQFVSRSLVLKDARHGILTGDLTWRNITKPVTLEVTFNGGAPNMLTGRYTLGFAATGTLRRADWGMDTLIPLVGDVVTLTIRAEFQRRS